MCPSRRAFADFAQITFHGMGRLVRAGSVRGGVALLVTALLAEPMIAATPQKKTPANTTNFTVEVVPAQIQRRTFDRAKPPADMPKLGANEAALCAYGFECQVEIQASAARRGLKLQPARVSELKLKTNLSVTVWLPVGGAPKLKLHEEAHREICEYVYRDAAAIGRRLGNKIIGTVLPNAPKDEASMQRELKKLQSKLMADYLEATAERCTRLQKYFDQITAHGTNELPERTALAQTLAQDRIWQATTMAKR